MSGKKYEIVSRYKKSYKKTQKIEMSEMKYDFASWQDETELKTNKILRSGMNYEIWSRLLRII